MRKYVPKERSDGHSTGNSHSRRNSAGSYFSIGVSGVCSLRHAHRGRSYASYMLNFFGGVQCENCCYAVAKVTCGNFAQDI